MRLTTETLMSLEAYAQARVPGECTVQAADLAELWDEMTMVRRSAPAGSQW